MTVDLSKAVKGSTVHFRCGGSAVIYEIEGSYLWFEESAGMHKYHCDGTSDHAQLLDIMRIDPPEFNWDDVKPGMAFVMEGEHPSIVYIYLCRSITGSYVFERKDNKSIYSSCPNVLTRAPEHDIEVK